MAMGNMIVTLVANTSKWQSGLTKAASQTTTFSQRVGLVFRRVAFAAAGIATSLVHMTMRFAAMGRESRKANVQLDFVVKRMYGLSRTTQGVVDRLKNYADQVAFATGIDDEQIKTIQKKLLVFKSLGAELGVMGGLFDRATMAALDLAAAGLGEAESIAIKLGRALQDPEKNLNALSRAGVTFTSQEREKIIALAESGKLLEAQDLILESIENRLGGIAERSATGFDKLNQRFQDMGDTIGEEINPILEKMNNELAAWIASPKGKEDLRKIADGFAAIAQAIGAAAIAANEFKNFLNDIGTAWNNAWKDAPGPGYDWFNPSSNGNGNGNTNSSPSKPNRPSTMATGLVVNFNTPVDSVSAGRELRRVLADYDRANGMRA